MSGNIGANPARFIGDSKMWLEANKAMKSAINLPWYRRK
ncbi:host cell division inhibitory peptide Kil [Escherichia coli]|nr:host cell division inhibitory peptide Kil [Escherichia coli]WHG70423.1 host cell division inhibitory peptide Kil [Escherichia coli]